MRLLPILALAVAAFAQAPPPFEIHGVVAETGSGPIAGARVSAQSFGNKVGEAYSNARGEFTVRISASGSYMVYAERPGYVADRISASRTIDANHPSAEINLQMFRPATVTGRVVDAETRKLIEGVEVVLNGGPSGSRIMSPSDLDGPFSLSRRQTDSNGAFTLSAMPVESATILVVDPRQRANLSSTAYDAEAFKIVDQQIDTPVLPLSLPAGATVNVGDILLKKAPRYRVHVSIQLGDCPQGESVRLYALRAGLPALSPQVAACGSEVLMRGFAPDNYTLYAVSDWQGERDNIENAVWGTSEFTVKDENVETSVVPKHGIIVEGTLTAADGVASKPERIGIGAQPTGFPSSSQPPGEQFIEWRENGRFRMAISTRPQTLVTNFGAAAYYVKQVFYNGVPQRDTSVPLNAATDVHHLEIVLDDKFASLIVTTDPDAYVYMWREGENGRLVGSPLRFNRWDGLAPGDYRVLAILGPITSNDLTARGEKITLRAGETQTFHAKLISASK